MSYNLSSNVVDILNAHLHLLAAANDDAMSDDVVDAARQKRDAMFDALTAEQRAAFCRACRGVARLDR